MHLASHFIRHEGNSPSLDIAIHQWRCMIVDMVASLKEIETLVDKLKPEDQAALLQYLLSRYLESAPSATKLAAVAAWQEFRCVGERLAKSDNGVSITDEISKMRR